MSGLDEYIDSVLERKDALVEFESTEENRSAVFTWGQDGRVMAARLVVADGKMHAEVTAFCDGEKQPLDIIQLDDAAMIFARTS